MLLALLSALAGVVALLCVLPILRHASRRSIGTLALVLGVPGYVFLYAFGHFEHPRKHWIVPAFVGALVLAVTLGGLLVHAREAAAAVTAPRL